MDHEVGIIEQDPLTLALFADWLLANFGQLLEDFVGDCLDLALIGTGCDQEDLG